MSLTVGIFRDPSCRERLIDARTLLIGGDCATDVHGFADASLELACTRPQAADVYYAPGWPWLVVSDGLDTVYEGRIEDRRLTEQGVAVTAFGLFRTLGDVAFSNTLSQTVSIDDIRPVAQTELSQSAPDRFAFGIGTQGLIGMAAKVTGQYSPTYRGYWTFDIRAPSEYYLQSVTVKGQALLKRDWAASMNTANAAWQLSQIWSVTNTTAPDTQPTFDTTVTYTEAQNQTRVVASLWRTQGPPALVVGTLPWLDVTVTVTMRLRTAAANIAQSAVRYAVARVGGGLSDNVIGLFMPSGPAVPTVFEDTTAADVLAQLAASQSPGWRYGVFDGQAAVLATPDRVGRRWLVTLATLELERTVANLATVVSAIWVDPQTGGRRRTLPIEDAAAIARFGRREVVIDSRRQFEAEALAIRDAYLANHNTPQTRAQATVGEVYTISGVPMPRHLLRANDTLVIRNLSTALASADPSVGELLVTRTRYDLMTGELTIEPDMPSPTVETLLAPAAGVSTSYGAT